MKRFFSFLGILTATTLALGYFVINSISGEGALSPTDELYRQKLVKINSRPLGDGLLIDPVSGFPFDNGYIKENGRVDGLGIYTSPTNIGLYLTYLVGIYEGKIDPFHSFPKEKALERIEQILTTLDTLPPEDKWEGLYYWMVYENGKWKRAADGKGNYVISQPDNGNLFAGFVTVLGAMELALKEEKASFVILIAKREESKSKILRSAQDDTNAPRGDIDRLNRIKDLVKKLILEADWKKLMDPERELYYLAFIPDTQEPLRFGGEHVEGEKGAPIYVENLMDEWRLGVLIAYAVSDLPESRTRGIPETTWTQLDREKRPYDAGGGKIIEALGSGHGGMFQQRLPLIFVPETEWSPAFRDNHNHVFPIAANFAQKLKQPYLFSAATNPEGRVEYVSIGEKMKMPVDTTYDEFGVKPLALKLNEEFNIVSRSEAGEPIGDVTPFKYASTPHALALGFLTHPVETIALFKKAEMRLRIFVFPGGLPDAYGIRENQPDLVSFRTLVLDQLMLVLSLQGDIFRRSFEEGLRSLGIYEKARKLYENEESFYPRIYPLKQEKLPEIDTGYTSFLTTGRLDYLTAVKLVRQLALESGFMLLSEESERFLAEKLSRRKLTRLQVRDFFQGNLTALSYGENGTFKPKRLPHGTGLSKARGWMGDRLPLVDLGRAQQLVLEVEPERKKASFYLELKGPKGEDFFPGKKYKVTIPAGKTTVSIPLAENHPQYLAYIAISDPSESVAIKNLKAQ
jgi:hypothetical protein